eukprot:186576-Amphidinium_carterae.1
MILADIVATDREKRTIMYPDWRVARAGPSTATAAPVTRRISGSHHIKTVSTVLLPTALSSRLITANSKRGVR